MAFQFCVSIGLVFSLIYSKVHADAGTQQPIINDGVQVLDDCHNACTELSSALEARTFYNSIPDGFVDSYFSSQQREVVPACIIQPNSPQEVSTAIQIIGKYECHFAVKSGGHARSAGESNADGGITIDLKYFNDIEVSEDQLTTYVGTANRWGEVYDVLDPLGLTVVGGRIRDVGVGGFLLGGGISFLSRMYGWASDNVRNYEVVLANGSISNINYNSHPDLYWALRGGGNNFGIVTRFDLETYPQGEVWGGQNMYLFSDIVDSRASLKNRRPFDFSLLTATQILGRQLIRVACFFGYCNKSSAYLQVMENKVNHALDSDPFLHLYMVVAYVPQLDLLLGSSVPIHSTPAKDPAILRDFKETLTPVYTTDRIRNLTSLSKEIGGGRGWRQLWASVTIKVNVALLTQIFDIFIEEMKTEETEKVYLALYTFNVQPLSGIAMPAFDKNGGNPFGILAEDGPLAALSIAAQWKNAKDDAAVQKAYNNFMDRSVALAKEMDMYHPYIYQNYANQSQDAFGGYGKENRMRLLDIQGKYDPERLFGRLQPGYFKL